MGNRPYRLWRRSSSPSSSLWQCGGALAVQSSATATPKLWLPASRSSKCKGVMHLLRCLFFIEARQYCYLHPVYIDTHANFIADTLSCNNLLLFLFKHPVADPHLTPIPSPLLDLLLDPSADRTSPRWSHLFSKRPSSVHPKNLQSRHQTYLYSV